MLTPAQNKIVNAYTDAFGKHYPQHRCEVKPTKGGYRVYINDEAGDLVLKLEDLQEATAAFNR